MANIKIFGDAIVITSAVSLEEIRLVEKYRPKELILMGGEDGKEPIFRVGTTTGAGEISNYGASFGRETHDEQKKACITMSITSVNGDLKEVIADRFGYAVLNLNKVEAKIPAVIQEIKVEKATIMENISVL